VPSDDKESEQPKQAPLPASVARALADARASAARTGTKRSWFDGSPGSRWLALVPVTVALLTMLLMMPRAAPPEDVPLPQVDGLALRAIERDDDARAAAAHATRLSGDALQVGTALRELNKVQVKSSSAEDIIPARAALDTAVRGVASGGDLKRAVDVLKSLRAVQLDAFLAEVKRFEATGKVTPELEELGGSFVERMGSAGWLDKGRVVLDDSERRVAFKLVWTAMVGGDRIPELGLSLDEQRVLYTLYIGHPHAPEAQRASFEVLRRDATSDAECKRVVGQERLALELWRIEKIKRLGALDATYPTAYALGVAYYRAGRFDLSMEAFRAWIAKHPDGPLSLRARNHLKAALQAYGPS
jgi:Arc/MetJ family transcription regulator